MKLRKITIIILFFLVVKNFFAQPGPPPGPGCWPPPCIPVDGGISLFTFLSVLFGYKFLSKNK